MTEIEKELAKLSEAYSKERLNELRGSLPVDGKALLAIASEVIKEFSFLVEASIVEGAAGNTAQAVHFHKLSFQCLQLNGLIMERARSEDKMEYFLDVRK